MSRELTTSPLPVFAHAIDLNPHAGAPHYYVGTLLLREGYFSQAMLEYRLATKRDIRFAPLGAKALVGATDNVQTLMSWPKTESEKSILYEALSRELFVQGRSAESALLDSRIVRLKNPTPQALVRQAKRIAAKHPREAIRLAKTLAAGGGGNYQLTAELLIAEIYQKSNRQSEAINKMMSISKRFHTDDTYLRQLATLYQAAGRHDDAIRTARKLRQFAGTNAEQIAAISLEADLEIREGNLHTAMERYKQALAMAPDNSQLLQKVWKIAKQLNAKSTETEALKRLRQLEPGQKQWQEELNRLQSQIIRTEI